MSEKRFAEFNGARVVLSGASSGLGQAIAGLLAGCGARLVLLGRNESVLNDMLGGLGGTNHQAVSIDLSDVAQLDHRLRPLLRDSGGVYGFCHCAGVVHTRSLHMSKPEMIDSQYTVNAAAGIELARIIASKELCDPLGGSMVFVSSVYAHVGAPGQIGYCASKGAVQAAVRAMAVELAPKKIKVNSVSPGFVRTEMTSKKSLLSDAQLQDILNKHPLGEGYPDDIARAVVFLLAPQNRWITGSDLVIDGGYTAQ